MELSSGELEGGGAAKGLSEGIGTGEGDWRLRVSTGLEVVVLAYVRTQDGFLGTLHDVVPEGEAGHRVVLFRSGRSAGGASRLRVVNPGVEAALVRIAGVDDAGDASSGAVSLVVPAGASRTVGARELERGASGLGGALGEGSGRWRLTVTADRPVEVMNLLASPGGQVSNLSAAPSSVGATETAAGVSPRTSRGRWCRASASRVMWRGALRGRRGCGSWPARRRITRRSICARSRSSSARWTTVPASS